LDPPVDIGQSDCIVGLENELAGELLAAIDELAGVLRDADLARNTVALHLVGNQDAISEDVVPDHLRADDSGDDPAGVDADSHVQVLEVLVFRLVPYLSNDVDHLEARLQDSVGFLDDVGQGPLGFVDAAVVAHDDVAVPDGVNLVDSVLVAELIESREKLRQEVHDLPWILGVLAESCELDHICEEEGAICELVDLPLLVLDHVEHVVRD
jgi:hypothetical protein